MKKNLVVLALTFVMFQIQGKTCSSGQKIGVKNTSKNEIEVFIVHPNVCPSLSSDLAKLKDRKALLAVQGWGKKEKAAHILGSETGPGFEALVGGIAKAALTASTYSEYAGINAEIVELDRKIRVLEHPAEHEHVSEGRVVPGFVCSSFKVPPGHLVEGFDRSSIVQLFVRSFEVHVWDPDVRTDRYTTYVKPGCILTYPDDFTMRGMIKVGLPGKLVPREAR